MATPAASADPVVPKPEPQTGFTPSQFAQKRVAGGFDAPPAAPAKPARPAPPVARPPTSAPGEGGAPDDAGADPALADGLDIDPNAIADIDGEPGDDANAGADLIHGMPADEVLAALADGTIPDALLDKLRIKAKVNGEEQLITLQQFRDGVQRQLDYSRGKQQLATEKRAFETQRDGFLGAVEGWRDKSDVGKLRQTLRELTTLGLPMRELAQVIAEDWYQRQQVQEKLPDELRPVVGNIFDTNARLERELEALRLQVQRGGHDQETQQQQARDNALRAKLNQFVKPAFAAAGIKPTPFANQIFSAHLRSLWDTSQELTQAVVDEAVTATKEELTEYGAQGAGTAQGAAAQAATGAQARTPARGPLPVRRAASAGGGAAAGKRNAGFTLSQFRAKLKPFGGIGA